MKRCSGCCVDGSSGGYAHCFFAVKSFPVTAGGSSVCATREGRESEISWLNNQLLAHWHDAVVQKVTCYLISIVQAFLTLLSRCSLVVKE